MKITTRLTVIVLSIILLLCACGRKDVTSSPKGTQSDNTSYSSDGASTDSSIIDVSDIYIGDSSTGLNFNFNSTPNTSQNSYVSDSGTESETDEDHMVYSSTYDTTSQNAPEKILTNQEMIDKCLAEGLGVIKTTINAGLKKSLTIARITDSHLTYAGGADDALAREQVALWGMYYTNAEQKLQREVNYAKAMSVDLVTFTGDIWNFITIANLQKFQKATSVLDDYLYCLGNHDGCWGINIENIRKSNTKEAYDLINKYVKADLSYDSRQVGEITIVAMDNVQYYFTESQVQRLEAEIKRGRPIILMMHTPLYTPDYLEELKREERKGEAQYIMGTPDDVIAANSGLGLRKMDSATKKMLDLINDNPKTIKGIFAGHMHWSFKSNMANGISQSVLCASYSGNGYLEMITIK